MKRWLRATLAALILMAGLASLAGCGGPQRTAGPRGSEEATIRVRNGSIELELRDDPDAEWEYDDDELEWTQKGRERPTTKPDLDIVIQTAATCKALPNNPKLVRVVHSDGTTVELKLHQQKTRAKVFVLFQGMTKVLRYAPTTTSDGFIKEIWVKKTLICTFTKDQPLEYMDLKR